MLRYPVILEPDTNGTVLVSFTDFPEAHTYGDDDADALAHARELLGDVIADYMDRRRDIPSPSRIRKGDRFVTVPALSEAKVELYRAMRAEGVRKADLARRLNCHMRQVDRLLNLSHASRLDQLEQAFQALGKRLNIEIQDAA